MLPKPSLVFWQQSCQPYLLYLTSSHGLATILDNPQSGKSYILVNFPEITLHHHKLPTFDLWSFHDCIKFANLIIEQMPGKQHSRKCPTETRESQNHFRFFWRERFDVHPPMHYWNWFHSQFEGSNTLEFNKLKPDSSTKVSAHGATSWKTTLQRSSRLILMGKAVQITNPMKRTQSWTLLLLDPEISIIHVDFTSALKGPAQTWMISSSLPYSQVLKDLS